MAPLLLVRVPMMAESGSGGDHTGHDDGGKQRRHEPLGQQLRCRWRRQRALSLSSPCSRSVETAAPKPNIAGPITPSTAKAVNRNRPVSGSLRAASPNISTPPCMNGKMDGPLPWRVIHTRFSLLFLGIAVMAGVGWIIRGNSGSDIRASVG